MNNFDKDIKRISKNIKLSSQEKADLKHGFDAFMTTQPEPSPWFNKQHFTRMTIARYTLAPLLLLFMIHITTLNAEQTIPGDFLYPFKTQINERVMQLVSFSAENKASTHIEISDRRLEELEELIIKEEITEETAQLIKEEIAEHTEAAFEHIETVSSKGNLEGAVEISEQIEVMLESHTDTIEFSTTTEITDQETIIVLSELKEDIAENLDKAEEVANIQEEKLEKAEEPDETTSTSTPPTLLENI